MWHGPEPIFGDKLAGLTADTVGLVLDPYHGSLEMLYEFKLSLGKPSGLLF